MPSPLCVVAAKRGFKESPTPPIDSQNDNMNPNEGQTNRTRSMTAISRQPSSDEKKGAGVGGEKKKFKKKKMMTNLSLNFNESKIVNQGSASFYPLSIPPSHLPNRALYSLPYREARNIPVYLSAGTSLGCDPSSFLPHIHTAIPNTKRILSSSHHVVPLSDDLVRRSSKLIVWKVKSRRS